MVFVEPSYAFKDLPPGAAASLQRHREGSHQLARDKADPWCSLGLKDRQHNDPEAQGNNSGWGQLTLPHLFFSTPERASRSSLLLQMVMKAPEPGEKGSEMPDKALPPGSRPRLQQDFFPRNRISVKLFHMSRLLPPRPCTHLLTFLGICQKPSVVPDPTDDQVNDSALMDFTKGWEVQLFLALIDSLSIFSAVSTPEERKIQTLYHRQSGRNNIASNWDQEKRIRDCRALCEKGSQRCWALVWNAVGGGANGKPG
ncbi:hypothetical protein E5288_WYG005991 [Bos mutus]|uniref:Uncharacterized protein n=1 Tax=Bos mutus TaxID=72004 RepID=A0A6B0R1H5_9CETA|nr:hypothetical protein [Bos mutus]